MPAASSEPVALLLLEASGGLDAGALEDWELKDSWDSSCCEEEEQQCGERG